MYVEIMLGLHRGSQIHKGGTGGRADGATSVTSGRGTRWKSGVCSFQVSCKPLLVWGGCFPVFALVHILVILLRVDGLIRRSASMRQIMDPFDLPAATPGSV
ncbi:hypothetical protein BJ322DRAFT_1125885 [Thelephora terrestris]|uniref:Uncharacterized protein n=1 Tax=Thelephora terrestris TaxID=56493 RepID=A0A9P6HBE2_9AGAM|nr:hypothetical protein BJ322DRAFT_1125885 [Thelephora terrestris]